MNMIYNSPHYCVVEFKDAAGEFGGFEIMDKSQRREMYLGGTLAESFRQDVEEMIARETSTDELDAFLGRFDGLMHHPLTMH